MSGAIPVGGHVPALVTPLRRDGEVDLDTFCGLVVRAFEHGSAAVLVGGSTGEGPLVPSAVRARLVAAAADVAGAGRVLACVSGSSLDEVHADVEGAVTAGAAAVLALAPFYFPLSATEHAVAQVAIADRSPVPVFVYHIPQTTGVALDATTAAELAAHPRIAGMKDSSGDLDGLRAFLSATAAHEFAVYQGNGPLVLAALEDGAAGSITAIANVMPAAVATVHDAHARGDTATAARAQDELTRVSALLGGAPGPLAVAVKAALQAQGVIPERTCWAPLAALDDEAFAALAATLEPTV